MPRPVEACVLVRPRQQPFVGQRKSSPSWTQLCAEVAFAAVAAAAAAATAASSVRPQSIARRCSFGKHQPIGRHGTKGALEVSPSENLSNDLLHLRWDSLSPMFAFIQPNRVHSLSTMQIETLTAQGLVTLQTSDNPG
ncbi:unnamed protein product [Schistocephalus solidus]|uniref:Uncharacterized protein n=1 Tax=Schistocephalus solidus TaxID=70667 RepID=A0A183TN34_SCHSO|nr:unnamed protein product [Schistocephalus solidus]